MKNCSEEFVIIYTLATQRQEHVSICRQMHQIYIHAYICTHTHTQGNTPESAIFRAHTLPHAQVARHVHRPKSGADTHVHPNAQGRDRERPDQRHVLAVVRLRYTQGEVHVQERPREKLPGLNLADRAAGVCVCAHVYVYQCLYEAIS